MFTAIQEVNRQENYQTFKPQQMPPQFIQDSDSHLQMQFLQAQLSLMQEQNAKQSAATA